MTSTKNAGTQFHGTYTAVVVSRVDPENNDRLLVKVPQVLGTAVSIWAKPQNELNTNSKIGDLLRVQFHGGDITKPSYHVDPTHPWEHPFNNLSQKFTTGPAVFYGRSMHKSLGTGADPKERGVDQLGNMIVGLDLYVDRNVYISGVAYSASDFIAAGISLTRHVHADPQGGFVAPPSGG